MKKALLLVWVSISMGLVAHELHAQAAAGAPAPRKWQIEVGIDAESYKTTGSMVRFINGENAKWNQYQGEYPLIQTYTNAPLVSPTVRGMLWHAIKGQYQVGIGLQYQWLRMQEEQRWSFPQGAYWNVELQYFDEENHFDIHRLAVPVAFARLSSSRHHRLSANLTPQLLLTGRVNGYQEYKHRGEAPGIFNPRTVQVLTVPGEEGYAGGFSGFNRVCLQAGLRYEYGFPLFGKWMFAGAGISYSLNHYQYRSDLYYSMVGYFNGGSRYLQTRTVGAQLGLALQL